MPHFSIEYSANLEPRVDIGALCEVVRKAAGETGIFPIGGIRVRAIRCEHYAIADGKPDYGFVAMLLRLGEGRDLPARQKAGAHVFVEKPLAATVADAARVVDTAARLNRKLGVGYILRHHPSWQRLIAEARGLGGPYVFRLNLNQQSTGATWETHKQLMQTTSPLVDCGVHYVDVMCQITDATPVRVNGMGLRLSDEIPAEMSPEMSHGRG